MSIEETRAASTVPRPELPWEGGCRCGRLRVRVTQPPILALACHCKGCQLMTGSAFSTSLAVPSAGFEVTDGEPVLGGTQGEQADHLHCDWCKSWVFTRIKPDMGFVNVRATMLDDARWFEPFVELCTDEALPWARTPAKHSYPAFPPEEAFGGMIAEFTSLP